MTTTQAPNDALYALTLLPEPLVCLDLFDNPECSRLALSTAPAPDTTMPVAPSSGSSSSAQASSSPPKPAVLIGDEELKQRAAEREALKQATIEFEKKWEEDRIKMVEADKEHMAMQVLFS